MTVTTAPVPGYWTQFRGPLADLIRVITFRVDRVQREELEHRARGMRTWLLGHMRVAQSTYEVVEALAMERQRIELGLEVAVAVPPLSRVILESVFSTIYVFDDPATRLPEFWKGAWAKINEQLALLTEDFGNDPKWEDARLFLAKETKEWRDLLANQGTPLSAEQLADYKTVRWPNPGKMPRKCRALWRKEVLTYLNLRYYGPLSIAAHLSGTGMLIQSGHLLPDTPVENQRSYFGQQFSIAFTMLLSLISVFAIDVIKDRDFATRVVELWNKPGVPDIGPEIYARCFKVQLEVLTR